MSKIDELKKEGVIKDTASKIIKGSEEVAIQAVGSVTAVLKTGLIGAEDLSIKVNDMLLNGTRRAITAGSIIGNDVHEAARNTVKDMIRSASEIGAELKNLVSKSSAPAEKPAKSD